MQGYIGYVRVSSKKQADRNLSIPEQIAQIERYCKQRELHLIQTFKETKSAYLAGERTVFMDLLNELKSNKNILGLILTRVDRISRNSEEFYQLTKILKKQNIKLICITEPTINTPIGRYVLRDNENRAVLYSEELSFKAKLGLLRAWRNNRFSGGFVPRGYLLDHKTKKLLPDQNEASHIQQAFTLYATGNYSYWDIADFLSKQGLVTRNNTVMTKTQVERILTDPTYTGKRTMQWNIKEGEEEFFDVEKAGKLTETYDVAVPLITEDLYRKVQAIRKQRTRRTGKNTSTAITLQSPYKPHAKCTCGRAITTEYQKQRVYYHCTRKISKIPKRYKTEKCYKPFIREEELENQLYNKSLRFLKIKPSELVELKKGLKEDLQEHIQNREQKLENYEKTKIAVKKQEKALTQRFIDEKLPVELYQQALHLIKEKQTEVDEASLNISEGVFMQENQWIYDFVTRTSEFMQDYKSRTRAEKYEFWKEASSTLIIDGKNIDTVTLSEQYEALKMRHSLSWRRDRDSNPGGRLPPPTGLANQPLQPLGYLSVRTST